MAGCTNINSIRLTRYLLGGRDIQLQIVADGTPQKLALSHPTGAVVGRNVWTVSANA